MCSSSNRGPRHRERSGRRAAALASPQLPPVSIVLEHDVEQASEQGSAAMSKRILILDGHPDPANERFVHALAAAYRDGAQERGYEVITLRAADLSFPLLRSQRDYEHGSPVASVESCQNAVNWATHVVILFPLWLGSMPALLKALLEQTFRPGFAFSNESAGRSPVKFHSGKSARLIVTMGMPSLLFRCFYLSHGVASLKRNVLRFSGFWRVRSTLIGSIGNLDARRARRCLDKVRAFGREGR